MPSRMAGVKGPLIDSASRSSSLPRIRKVRPMVIGVEWVLLMCMYPHVYTHLEVRLGCVTTLAGRCCRNPGKLCRGATPAPP